MICLNVVILVFCIKLANIRTIENEGTREYIESLEETVEKEREYRQVLWNYIDYLKEH